MKMKNTKHKRGIFLLTVITLIMIFLFVYFLIKGKFISALIIGIITIIFSNLINKSVKEDHKLYYERR